MLLDAAEFDSALNCSLGEDFLGVWEGGHQILQFLLLQTVSVGGVFHGGLVGLGGTQAHQDLVITKVVGWVQGEILVLILVGEGQGNTSLEDEIELGEVLQSLHHGLIGYKDATVEGGYEKGEEFVATFEAIIVLKNMSEVLHHGAEELFDKPVSEARLELVEVFVLINQLFVVIMQ